MINRRIKPLAACAEQHARHADHLAVDRLDITERLRPHRPLMFRPAEFRRIQNYLHVAALQFDKLPEFLERRAVGEDAPHLLAPLLKRLRRAADAQHLRAEFNRQLDDIRRAAAAQHVQRFEDFQRVADHLAERLIHVGDERHRVFAHHRGDFDEVLR